jgi:predicted esterase
VSGAVLLVLLILAPTAAGAPRPEKATWADLAVSYLRLQEAYRDHPPARDRLAEVNRAFDRATFAFFRGGFSKVCRDFDALAASLRPEDERPERRGLLEAMRVRLEPRFATPDIEAVRVRVVTVYERPPSERPIALVLRLVAAGRPVAVLPFEAPPGPVDLRLAVPPPEEGWSRGAYDVEVVHPAGPAITLARLFVTARPVGEIRASLSARLEKLELDDPALLDAAAAARDRLSLLREDLDPGRSVVLLTDPIAHARALEDEVRALEEGRDPYRDRVGHLWRRFPVGRKRHAVRLFSPPRTSGPLPVVVALHGAGADENVFPEAYGAGVIVDLAKKHGFLLVSPSTPAMMMSPRALDALLDTVALHATIDRDRVHLVGHSMGAMTAVSLAQTRAPLLASVCAIAGGGRVLEGRDMPPTLFVTGKLDPIVPSRRVVASFRAFERAGRNVELREEASYGHTLLVGDLLPDVVAWMLSHERSKEDDAGAR